MVIGKICKKIYKWERKEFTRSSYDLELDLKIFSRNIDSFFFVPIYRGLKKIIRYSQPMERTERHITSTVQLLSYIDHVLNVFVLSADMSSMNDFSFYELEKYCLSLVNKV